MKNFRKKLETLSDSVNKEMLELIQGEIREEIDLDGIDFSFDYSGRRYTPESLSFAKGGVVLPEEGVVYVRAIDDEFGTPTEFDFKEIPLEDRIAIFEFVTKNS